MARETFPYSMDRKLIRDFLRRDATARASTDHVAMASTPDGLALRLVDSGSTVAWFAPDGTLQCMVSSAFDGLSTMRLINYICETLGLADRVEMITGRALVFTSPPTPRELFQWQGYDLRPGQPFVVTGPLTIQAWRAANPAAE